MYPGTLEHLAYLKARMLQARIAGRDLPVVFLDLTRAFNTVTVNHHLLLHKILISHITSSLFTWLRALLSDRRMGVVDSRIRSRCFNAVVGVPQGSCLGPCYLIFI